MFLSHSLFLSLLGLALTVSAQEMPECAATCLVAGLGESTCGPTDFECICADTELMGAVETCSMGTCTVLEGLAAQNATATFCQQPVRDRRWVAPIGTIVSGTFALLAISIRLSEGLVQRQVTLADASAYTAWAWSMPMNVGEFLMMKHGMGRDIWTLTETQITNVVKWTWVTQITYIPAINLTKVAILLFFINVFPVQKFQWVCWGTVVHCVLFMISTFIASILACIPVEYAWVSWKGEGDGICYDNNAFWWAVAGINIATDVFILALPIPQIIRLQLGLKPKIYLVMMFNVGIIITVISIVRFEGLLTYSTSANPTYNNIMVATYSVVECNVSIICCCMPAILAFLRRYFPNAFQSSRNATVQSDPAIVTIGGSGSKGGWKAGSRGGINKSITASVIHSRRNDSDVELMDIEENDKYRSRW
ncbi:CFEM domain-containing protein [Sarocladium implicatum]|nr:CFEM domain-containing protein [Sarocladium implicatum]